MRAEICGFTEIAEIYFIIQRNKAFASFVAWLIKIGNSRSIHAFCTLDVPSFEDITINRCQDKRYACSYDDFYRHEVAGGNFLDAHAASHRNSSHSNIRRRTYLNVSDDFENKSQGIHTAVKRENASIGENFA
jgi:hypothetical protein